MTIDVAKKITKRRQQKETDYEALTELHRKERAFLQEIDSMAQWMAKAVMSMLSDQIEDMNASEDVIRSSFHRSFRRLLSQLTTRTEKVVFFHEAVPGFTALTVRKGEWEDALVLPSSVSPLSKLKKTPKKQANKVDNKVERLKAPKTPECINSKEIDKEREEAIQSIIHAYINRTGNRVIAIDGLDITLVLFPVDDLKQNLREMGFWSS